MQYNCETDTANSRPIESSAAILGSDKILDEINNPEASQRSTSIPFDMSPYAYGQYHAEQFHFEYTSTNELN